MTGSRSERTRRSLSRWLADRNFGSVQFTEDTNPAADPDGSYQLDYVATFDPPSLRQVRVEVWVTDEGEIAVGLERFGRVADRLGVRCSLNDRRAFAAGHEPLAVSDAGLLGLLDLVADGELALSVACVPLAGLLGVAAVLPDGAPGALVSSGYSVNAQFRDMRSLKPRPWRRFVDYERW